MHMGKLLTSLELQLRYKNVVVKSTHKNANYYHIYISRQMISCGFNGSAVFGCALEKSLIVSKDALIGDFQQISIRQ